MDMGCHAIEFFRWILGKDGGKAQVAGAFARLGTYVHGDRTDGDDEARLVLDFEGGEIAVAEESWTKPGGMDDRAEVFGSEGQVYADLLLGNDGGAKWGSYEIHFYDPASGTFVENGLSREMSRRLAGNNLVFHPATARIELDHLVFGNQDSPAVETFVLEGSHLRQVGEETGVKLRRNM